MAEYVWWEEIAGIPALVDEGYIARIEGEDETIHYRLTEKGLEWSLTGDGAEEVQMP